MANITGAELSSLLTGIEKGAHSKHLTMERSVDKVSLGDLGAIVDLHITSMNGLYGRPLQMRWESVSPDGKITGRRMVANGRRTGAVLVNKTESEVSFCALGEAKIDEDTYHHAPVFYYDGAIEESPDEEAIRRIKLELSTMLTSNY